ncbi:hypothetical protein HF086_009530 [Spodoptera exigua]|uniref:SWIM-type domain-containing protein n=1 Tax=Spodoptera exigua TaxID=7107 RepID=A0A922MEX8_SPOEX|nr:hypothetical protein HF086_009530 [Spodoptera exigua]
MGPYPATKNDASIMNDIMSEGGAFTHLFREDDVFILDRGFRDCADNMTDKGFFIHMPETISTGERQLSTLQANISRCVTMNRWVVEAVNGRFSRDFKIFREVYLNKRCPHIMEDFRIAAAFLNHFAVQFRERANVREIIEIIDAKIFEDNELCEVVQQHNLNMRSTLFQSISHTNIEFPELTINDLELIALGTYQIRQAKSYVGEHLRVHGMYTLEVCQDNAPLQGIFNDSQPSIIRGRIKSRHIGSKSYFTYIAVNRRLEGRSAIVGYYCHCPVGTRTVGCCSHVMSILWYMGYARHQESISAPATFLDNLLVG